MQAKEEGQWGCKVVIPHESKKDQDVVFFLPTELLAPNEEEARELGCLAMLRHIAGVPAQMTACPAARMQCAI